MKLEMYLSSKLIDSIEVNPQLLTKINLLKDKLEEKHHDIIDLSKEEPVYIIDQIPSRSSEHLAMMQAKDITHN